MEIHQARQILETHFKYPPETANEARIVLDKYDRGEIAFPVDQQGIIYMALQTLMCEGMGDNHRADSKRFARSNGQKLRKNRTGSRRG